MGLYFYRERRSGGVKREGKKREREEKGERKGRGQPPNIFA